MTKLTNDIYAIEVPEGITDFRSFVKGVKNDELDIPEGEAKFLFVTLYATEEQAAAIVESIASSMKYTYKDYMSPRANDFYGSAVDSLVSLFLSKGLDPVNKNYVLIKKIA